MILYLCDVCGRLFSEATKVSVSKKNKDFFVGDLCLSCEEHPIDLDAIRKSKEEILRKFHDLEGRISIKRLVEFVEEREGGDKKDA